MLHRHFKITLAGCAFWLLCLFLNPAAGHADTFCERVLNVFDFNFGVFAGPDPDALPDEIFQYIESVTQNRVRSGKLSTNHAEYFLQSIESDARLPSQIADRCRRDPHGGWEVVDTLITPRLESGSIDSVRAETADTQAREQLLALSQACLAYLMESGTNLPCSLERAGDPRLTTSPLPDVPEINLVIHDGSLDGFEATARHRNGSRTWRINATGHITSK